MTVNLLLSETRGALKRLAGIPNDPYIIGARNERKIILCLGRL